MKPIKSILISQPFPENGINPYEGLTKNNIKIDFRNFVQVDGVSIKDFKNQKIDLTEFKDVVLTSKNSVDHYFRLIQESRLEINTQVKYFCKNENIAKYLQKYIRYRKRKIFYSENNIFDDLIPDIKEDAYGKLLIPVSEQTVGIEAKILKKNKIAFKEAIMYRTVSSNLQDLSNVNYDILVFFSPMGIDSLFENFPNFKQNKTTIAVWGKNTSKIVKDKGLTVNIEVPTSEVKSMKQALELYIESRKKI